MESDVADRIWIELLREGLTYDLRGLAQGPGCGFPRADHKIDLDPQIAPSRYEALHLLPGHHLAGGHRTMPVVKGLIATARDLTHHFSHLEAVVWPASKSAIGRRFFESTTTAWLDGGPFPALGLTAFRQAIDGAFQSVGLEFWIGQELRIEPSLVSDQVTATRIGVRLINHLILMGGLEKDDLVTAPDGTRLALDLSENGRYIRVRRG
ncbi:MAG: hypothetical protein AAFN04_01430 [Pseudomonadota bacterium]